MESSGDSDRGKKLNLFYPSKPINTSNNFDSSSPRIVSKPSPIYTDAAQQNQIVGTVALQVNFLASGRIGKISVISGLPDYLTEQAIAAAMQIKFKPAIRDGKPVAVSKTITYSFTPYNLQ